MPIDNLFKVREAQQPAAIAARITSIVERVRSHAIGLNGCWCSSGAFSTLNFAEFQDSLIHHVSATYPELNVESATTLNELVDKTLASDKLARDKAEQVLSTTLKALTSYAEQCRGFRSDGQG